MKLSEIMKRSTFIRGSSKVIFSVNYADITSLGDITELNKHVQMIIEKMPKRSMLLLLDTRKLCINGEIIEHLRDIFVRFAPYFKSSAVIVDAENEKSIRGLAESLGFKKMALCSDLESARKRLFDGDPYAIGSEP